MALILRKADPKKVLEAVESFDWKAILQGINAQYPDERTEDIL
jgi:hypothetical protein